MNFLKKQSRFVVCQFGDEHGGSELGLMNPEVELKDAQGHKRQLILTEAQKYLDELKREHVDKTIEFADGDDLYILNLGDITQGNKHFPEKISTKIADQIHISRANFWYWRKYKNIKAIRLVVGTPAHDFGEQTAEELTIEYVKQDMPKIDSRVLYHGLLDIRNVLFDYSHRGPTPGKRNWLRGNEARYYLRSLMEDELHLGNTPPHLVSRAHYHSFVEEYLCIEDKGIRHKSWIYTLPSYCFLGEYAINITSSQYIINHGMIATEIVDGKIGETIVLKQTVDLRTKEKIQ